MSGPDQKDVAAQVLAAIDSLLDEKTVHRLIDAPIDRAVETFRFSWEPPFSPRKFHRILAELVAHIHACCGQRGAVLLALARDEAVSLLTQQYSGPNDIGYDGSLHDLMAPPEPPIEGIDVVLQNLAEIVKATKRQLYVDWVYARCLDTRDRELMYAVAELIREQNRQRLPEEILKDEIYELVPHIRDLLEAIREARLTARQARSSLPPPI